MHKYSCVVRDVRRVFKEAASVWIPFLTNVVTEPLFEHLAALRFRQGSSVVWALRAYAIAFVQPHTK
jgi:hypothetical protein